MPPPLGPEPDRRSGATTMKPAAARSSAIDLAQSERPKISWMRMTTGTFCFDLGVDDEGLDGAVAVLDWDVFAMTG